MIKTKFYHRTLFMLIFIVGLMDVALTYGEPVSVRGQKIEDYAQVVFTWQNPVGHTLTRDGDQVTVRFSRPIEATLSGVVPSISGFVEQVTADNDGNSIRFRLSENYDVYSYDSGRSVTVEIAPKEGAETAAATEKSPTQLTAQSTAAEFNKTTIKVRVGAHDEFTRLVFDWKTKTPYTFSRQGNVGELVFAKSGDIELSKIKSDLPKFVGAIEQSGTENSVVVRFSVPASSLIKHFLSGNSIVVDINQPTTAADKAGPLIKNIATKTDAPTTAESKTEAVKTAAAPENAATTESSNPDVEKRLKPKNRKPPEKVNQVAAVDLTKTEKPTATLARVQTETQARPQRLEPQVLATPAEGQVALENADDAKITSIASTDTNVLALLRFDWDEPVGAAVFRRAGALWVVFDKLTQVDTSNLNKVGGKSFKVVQQIPINSGTVLRFLTESSVNPSLSRDGLAWILSFKKQDLVATTPVEINADPNSSIGARVFLPVTEPGKAIPITDPEVGDNLIVIPLVQLGYGTQKPYDFAQVRFLQTGQGVVISPRIDDLRVRTLRQGVEISGTSLELSPVGAGVAASAKLASLRPLAKILKLDKWILDKPEDYFPKKLELLADIATATPEQRTDARFNMARFYLANGYGAEALGVMGVIASADPDITKTPEFNMLIGGSRFLMGRYDEADLNFSKPDLVNNDEARLWRALIVAARGDLSTAGFELRRVGGIARSYPVPLRTPVGRLIAKAAIEIGDVKQAEDYLSLLRLDNTDPAALAELDYIEARLLQLGGDDDGAIKKWDSAIENGRRKVKVQASFARMELMLNIDRMSRPEAIRILEGMRFIWRDDEFEFNLLRRLGDYYIEEGRFRDGFLVLRQAATVFRDNVEAPQVTQKMTDTFNYLYLNDGDEVLTPVRAIGLYEEFKELTPAGSNGDLMIRKLADRLVRVDLLDSAAALLENQIKFRLKGELKASVGTRLALVRIIAREYDQALQALDDSLEPNLPEELSIERRHLRAQALMGAGNKDAALELLKTDKTSNGDLLKAEMYWQGSDWAKSSLFLKRMLTASGAKPNELLDTDQATIVLNLAVAMTLSGNERALKRLRRDYTGPMEVTNYKDAFNLVTSPGRLGLIPPGAVSALVKDAENFKTFLSDYLERIKEDDLSGVAAPIINDLDPER